MSKKAADPVVEDPEIDEEEESDDYDNNIEEEEEDEAGYEDEEEEEGDEEDEAGLTKEGQSLTALLLAGNNATAAGATAEGDEDEDEEDEDEDYEEPAENGGPTHANPIPTHTAVTGTKRAREDDEEALAGEDLSGDYGEVDENSNKVLNKKARAEAEEA